MLKEAGDDDTGIGQECIKVRAGSDTVREHLSRTSIRIKSDCHREPAAVVLELDGFGRTAMGKTLPGHRTPPRVSIAQSRMAIASASLSSAGEKPRARTAAMTAALSALPLPVMKRLIVPTGTPW